MIFPGENDSLYVILYLTTNQSQGYGKLCFASGSIQPVAVSDPVALPFTAKVTSFPNPFTTNLQVNVDVNKASTGKIDIYNVKGQKITSLATHTFSKGTNVLHWDGKDINGKSTAAGLYFLHIQVGEKQFTQKVLRLH
jgi:flagellar hook assembly protein FlgD